MSIQSITNSGFSGTKARSIVKAETEPVNIYKMSYEVVAGAGGGGGGAGILGARHITNLFEFLLLST